MSDNPDTFLLGKIDGKLDTALALLATHADRFAANEQDIGKLKTEIAVLKASATNDGRWVTRLTSFAALAVSAINVLFHYVK